MSGNWDTPSVIDFTSCLQELEIWKKKVDLVLIEGFMLYHDPVIVSLMDVCVWLEVGKETAMKRRLANNRTTKEYYENCIWPNYEKYCKLDVANLMKCEKIDGEKSKEQVFEGFVALLPASTIKPFFQ